MLTRTYFHVSKPLVKAMHCKCWVKALQVGGLKSLKFDYLPLVKFVFQIPLFLF